MNEQLTSVNALKVGDELLCVEYYTCRYTVGKTYKITKIEGYNIFKYNDKGYEKCGDFKSMKHRFVKVKK